MSDLDLDKLERQALVWARLNNDPEGAAQNWRDLFQRLRETEAMTAFVKENECSIVTNSYLAQLERVREAATKLLEVEFFAGSDFGQLNGLRAALAALEEPVP